MIQIDWLIGFNGMLICLGLFYAGFSPIEAI